jgi:hypothetical protein
MAFESEFLDLMPDTLEVQAWASESSDGVQTYSATVVSYRCRIVGKSLSLRRPLVEGDTMLYDAYVATGLGHIGLRDKITLPNDARFPDRFPLLFAVAIYTDETPGVVHHTKLQFGWTYHRQGS